MRTLSVKTKSLSASILKSMRSSQILTYIMHGLKMIKEIVKCADNKVLRFRTLDTRYNKCKFYSTMIGEVIRNVLLLFLHFHVRDISIYCGPWTNNISITWEFVRNAQVTHISDLLNQNVHFNKSQSNLYALKHEKQML